MDAFGTLYSVVKSAASRFLNDREPKNFSSRGSDQLCIVNRSNPPSSWDSSQVLSNSQSTIADIKMPKPPYSHLSEEEKRDLFEKWMVLYQKSYKNGREKRHRFEKFKHNMEEIEEICNLKSFGSPCIMGLNKFSDLDYKEFSRLL